MSSSALVAFADLARAAYCPRQLYYVRRADERTVPADQRERIDLAFGYGDHLDAPDATLAALPIDPEPPAYRRNLRRCSDRDEWDALVDPDATRVLVEGRDCRGIVHKILERGTGPPVPSIVSPGTPPDRGVWEPQAVRAVAAAKALSWNREREVPRAFVEYPAVGVVRRVRLTVRKTATYRRVLRTVRGLDGPPPRVNDARCESCSFRAECGTKTRSLRSLLGS